MTNSLKALFIVLSTCATAGCDPDAPNAMPLPPEEVCNAEDDDGDGNVDERDDCFDTIYRLFWSNNVDDVDFIWGNEQRLSSERPNHLPDYRCEPDHHCLNRALAFRVRRQPAPGTVPLYQAWHFERREHVLTIDEAALAGHVADGYDELGVIGHVYPIDARPGTDRPRVPLFAVRNKALTARFYTIVEAEVHPENKFVFGYDVEEAPCCQVYPIEY